MSRWLDRLGRSTVRHRWWFVAVWVIAAVGVGLLAKGLDGQTTDNFRIGGSQSQEALDLLETQFPSQSGSTATVVFQSNDGIDDPTVKTAISESVTNLAKIPHVTSVTDPYGPLGAAIVSKSGDIALVTVQYDELAQKIGLGAFDQITAATAPAEQAGVRLAYGGAVVDFADQPPEGNADLIGLLAAVVILLFVFGSVVAMGLPILTALFGLGIGISLINIVAAITDIGTLAPTLATMIGLGVGIDYSLFIVTRYRENLAAGMPVEAAVGHSVATAGSAVIFAGCTVVIAISGLAVSGIPYVARLGYMSAMVVAVMMLAAITFLPAIIGIVGHNIDKLRVPSFLHHPNRDTGTATAGPTFWERWAVRVADHKWVFAIVGTLIMLVIASPFLSMRLGESDDGNLPTSTTQRQAYDLIAQGFGPGANGPLLVVVSLPPNADETVVDDISAAIKQTPGVSGVLPAELQHRQDGGAARRVPDERPGERRDQQPRADAARRDPEGDLGQWCHRRAGIRGRCDGDVHRHLRPDRVTVAAVHLRGRAALVPAVDARLPLGPRAAHRCSDEPALGGSRVRRDRGGVPVGLGEGPHRPREHGPHRLVRADDDVRGAVRAVDGLPGVPAHADPRGVRRLARHTASRRARALAHRARDHVGRARS